MTKKKEEEDKETMEILNSKQEVADELKMSLQAFERLERRYPFNLSGVSGRICGRWKVGKEDVQRWFGYVQRQESRHPDARRMRPEEPPALTEIKGRTMA